MRLLLAGVSLAGGNFKPGQASSAFDIFEIALILIVALVVIGPEQLPSVLQAAGKILRELRSASNEVLRELSEVLEDDSRSQAQPSGGPAPRDQPDEAPTTKA